MAGLKLVVAGRPGVGKTTLIERAVARLRKAGVSVCGFTTGEIRVEGRRVGFEIDPLHGPVAILAHTDLPGPHRVGRYGVDVDTFERVALPALAEPAAVCVIDEIGKMELMSDRFVATLGEIFDQDRALLASVHSHRHPVTDRLKRHPAVELVHLTRSNRDELAAAVVDRLIASITDAGP